MITLKKLAEELKISVSTVSKALNDSYEISDETIAKVKKLAESYNYRPNKIALKLRSSKTNTIGVIIPDILNRFLAKVLYGIERQANKHGFDIITCISNESLGKEKKSMKLLTNGSVDGFIIAPSEETLIKKQYTHINNIIEQGYPLVMFDREIKEVACDKVFTNNFESTYNITKKLIEQKRNKILFISGNNNLNTEKLRAQGYNKAMEESNLDTLVLEVSKKDDKQFVIKSFLKQNANINAIISADNTLGTIAINLAIKLGYNVPKDIAVIGFASESVSNFSSPRLTIVKQHAKSIGENAVNLLLKKLDTKNNTATKNQNTEVIVNNSLIKKESF